MKIGIVLNAYSCPLEDRLALMKKYGFETTFCFSDIPDLEETMNLCEKYGIKVENYHAPFSHINDIWYDVPEGEAMLKELIDGVDNCKRYGVDTLVVHLWYGTRAVRVNDLGFSRLDRLMSHARENGVTIAYENLCTLANLASVLEEYDEAGFCWDTGHEQCYTDGKQYMPLFGDRLAALHVHDNYCMHQNDDSHMIPYDGFIDFDRVASQIASTDYSKSVMLETMDYRTLSYVQMGADAFYQKAAEAAKRLAREIERRRAEK